MSASNATELATLAAHLAGTDLPYRASATNYLALFTSDPGETASLVGEANYVGYARIPLTKASAWNVSVNPAVNTSLLQFGICTSGSNAITHFAVVDTASGAVSQCISGALSATLNVSSGIQPQFGPGVLAITAD